MQSENKQQQQQKAQYRKALQLFLAGDQYQLDRKLQELAEMESSMRARHNLMKKDKPKGKFQYQLNFEEQEQQEDKNGKGKAKGKPKPRMQAQRKSQYCPMCPDNEQLHLLSASNFVYLAMPKLKTFRKYHHFIIAPVDHIQTKIGADQAVLEEIKNYQKCLIQMFDKMGQHAIFLQQFSQNNSHIYIECIGIPLKKAYDLPFFFRQALENVQGFWTTHKKIIQITKQKGGLEKQIPKQMKYFYIDFGLGYGYAHVIEDQKYWDRYFCYEIVAAAIGLESFSVRTTEEFNPEELEIKSRQFNKLWKQFDWTVLIGQEETGK